MHRKGLSLLTVLALLLCCMGEGKFALAFFHDGDGPHVEAFSDHHGADHELDCACSTLSRSPNGFELPTLLATFSHVVPTALPLFRRPFAQGSETIREHPTPIYLRHQTLLV